MENDDIDETSDISNFPYEDNYLEPQEPEEISEEYQDTSNGKGKSVRLRSTKFSYIMSGNSPIMPDFHLPL